MSTDTLPTTNGALAAKTTGARRGRRPGASKNETFLYCLEAGNGEGGKLQLSKPKDEDEILEDSLKNGVPFYRLQKFKAATERTSDGLKIVAVPVE